MSFSTATATTRSRVLGSLARVPANSPTSLRAFSTSSVRASPSGSWGNDTVDLAFDVIEPKEIKPGAEGQSVVIAHGLFGSKQNWRTLGNAFAKSLGMPVYMLDLRNHGVSPHAAPHTYQAMAEDMAAFLEKRGLKEGVNLIGHSMGGKTCMALALNPHLNKPVRSLVSVDMVPRRFTMPSEFPGYIKGMRAIERAKVRSRAESDSLMEPYERDMGTRLFLLTNLKQVSDKSTGERFMRFRNPLDLFESSGVANMGDFPYVPPPPVGPDSPTWDGPVLLLRGMRSAYVNREGIATCEAFFPNTQVVPFDAGHWLQHEQPERTEEVVVEFITGVGKKGQE